VRFVEENFGESELAERFGVEQYPAIFVDAALVFGPWDFYEWPGTPRGRYVPFLEASSRERFARDFESFVERRLAGEDIEGAAPSPGAPPRLESLPAFEAVTLGGEPISSEDFRDRVVLVEFWASWCPPCVPTLSFLAEVERTRGDRVAVLPIAVSSEETAVREVLTRMAGEGGAPSRTILGTDDLAARFGGVLAVPTLMVFGRDGKVEAVFHGAPPELHERVAALLGELERRVHSAEPALPR
jgi:thiol-disulfide isomerase/thioredoxin